MVLAKTCLLVGALGACAVEEAAGAPSDGTTAQAGPAETSAPVATEAAPSPPAAQAGSGPCGVVAATEGFASGAIPAHAGPLTVELHAKVHEAGYSRVDMVVGLGKGTIDAFSDLATSVRFNSDGYVDARNGGVYQAVNPFQFRYDHLYAVRFVVDRAAHTYAAYIRTYDTPGPGDLIASGYAFRTEQRAVDQLDALAYQVDSPTGTLYACVQTVSP